MERDKRSVICGGIPAFDLSLANPGRAFVRRLVDRKYTPVMTVEAPTPVHIYRDGLVERGGRAFVVYSAPQVGIRAEMCIEPDWDSEAFEDAERRKVRAICKSCDGIDRKVGVLRWFTT